MLLLLSIGLGVWYFFYKPSSSLTSNNESSPVAELTNETPSPKITTNPMESFATALFASDYKVTSSGKFDVIKQDDSSTVTSSLDLNNGTIYLKKGAVVKIENNDADMNTTVYRNGTDLYVISPDQKTYSILESSNSIYSFFDSIFVASYPLIPLLEDTQQGIVTWQKNSNNEWQADWAWKTPFDLTDINVQVKVSLDSETGLITTLYMKFEGSDQWQEGTFVYEKIENID